ncbi:hypothetical protein [Kitasatospora sp. NPDC088134]|uniref:hypothetical protein n=1 Tax=Kitasatospora sp. NPDC088134 TaxID=3364071 RepID=UPI003824E284
MSEKEPPQDLCVKLRAAADRLIAGTPLHSSGKLTILDLAQEAQIKRWVLTHKYPATLMAKYQAEFKALQQKSEPVKAAEDKLAKVTEELAETRKENRKLRDLVLTYAVMIDQLAVERAQAVNERDQAIAARDAALANVTPITRARSRRDDER